MFIPLRERREVAFAENNSCVLYFEVEVGETSQLLEQNQ